MTYGALSLEELELRDKLIQGFSEALDLNVSTLANFANMPSYGPVVQRALKVAEKHRLIRRDNRTEAFSFLERSAAKAARAAAFAFDTDMVGPLLVQQLSGIRREFAASVIEMLYPPIPSGKASAASLKQVKPNRNGNRDLRNG